MKHKLKSQRPQCFWGTVIPAVASLAGSIFGSYSNKKIQEEAFARQQANQERLNTLQNYNQQASNLNNYLATQVPEERYYQYAFGGRKKLRNIKITDGGIGIPIGNNAFLLRGSSHDEVNEAGRTGIGMKAGDSEFEGQDGEVVQQKNNIVRIFSDDIPITKDGTTPAEAVQQGMDPNLAFKAQEAFKKHYGLNNDGTMKNSKRYTNRRNRLRNSLPVEGRRQAALGAEWYVPDYIGLGVNVLGSVLANTYGNRNYNSLMKMYDKRTLPTFTPESRVSMDTNFTNYAKHAAAEREALGEINAAMRNSASSATALDRVQNVNQARAIEHNKIFDEDAQRNFEARLKDAELDQQMRARRAAAANEYSARVAEIENDMLKERVGLASSKMSSNVGMIQGIGSSIGNFLQAGIDNRQNRIARGLITSTALGLTPEKVDTYAPGHYDKRDIQGFYEQQLREYRDNPTEEGAKLVNYWQDKLPKRYRLKNMVAPIRYFAPAVSRLGNNSLYSTTPYYRTPNQILR